MLSKVDIYRLHPRSPPYLLLECLHLRTPSRNRRSSVLEGIPIAVPFQRLGADFPCYEVLLDVLCGEGLLKRWVRHPVIYYRSIYALHENFEYTVQGLRGIQTPLPGRKFGLGVHQK